MPVKLCGICTVLHSPAQGPAQAGAPGARIRRQLGWFRFQTLRVPGHSAFNACAKCSLLRRLQVRRSDLFDIVATGNRPWDRSGTRALRASVPSTEFATWLRYFGVSVRRALATSACEHRWIGPKRARAQLRGRPISEKALIILECKEAFANTELSPLNNTPQGPVPPE